MLSFFLFLHARRRGILGLLSAAKTYAAVFLNKKAEKNRREILGLYFP